MSAKPITIAGVFFRTETALFSHLRGILRAGGPNDQIIDPSEVALLNVLFHARQSKVDELQGRTIVGWGREQNNASLCFAALCDDGTKLHFSFKKSVKALYAKLVEDE